VTLSQFFKFSLLPACAAWLCLAASYQVVIRTNVHAVEVSVIATDSKGLPVSGLGAADFRVFDNGREQTVASFEKISSRAAPAAALPPNAYSNRIGKQGEPQVLSMILLDAVNTKYRYQHIGRQAVESILTTMEPVERVALYAFGSELRTLHEFSSDKQSLLAKLRAYRGESTLHDDFLPDYRTPPRFPPPPLQTQAFDHDRIVNTFAMMEALAKHVKGIPGRKNLLWVSEGFPLLAGFRIQDHFQKELGRATAALNDAGVSVYPIDARGLVNGGSFLSNIATFRDVADATGGKAYFNRNDLGRGVRMALDDSREAYVMTYYPKDIAEDGAYHQILVRSTRPGVQLRFRRGYYAAGREDDSSAGAVDRLARALSSPLDSSEIGIQASVEQTSGAGDLAVVIHVDPADLSLAHATETWTGSLRLVGMQIGATGERYEGQSQTAQLDLPPATYQRALEQGVRLELRLKREPDAVAMRIAVADERGARVGSLSVPLPPAR
jgi:VWFA-related protein